MVVWVGHLPVVVELRIDPEVRRTGLGVAALRIDLEVEERQIVPVEAVLHTEPVEVLHMDLVEALHIDPEVVHHTRGVEGEHHILVVGEERHILAVGEEHHTVLGVVVRHTDPMEAAGHIRAEAGNRLGVVGIVDSALGLAGTAAEGDRIQDLGGPDTAVGIRLAGYSYKPSEICVV